MHKLFASICSAQFAFSSSSVFLSNFAVCNLRSYRAHRSLCSVDPHRRHRITQALHSRSLCSAHECASAFYASSASLQPFSMACRILVALASLCSDRCWSQVFRWMFHGMIRRMANGSAFRHTHVRWKLNCTKKRATVWWEWAMMQRWECKDEEKWENSEKRKNGNGNGFPKGKMPKRMLLKLCVALRLSVSLRNWGSMWREPSLRRSCSAQWTCAAKMISELLKIRQFVWGNWCASIGEPYWSEEFGRPIVTWGLLRLTVSLTVSPSVQTVQFVQLCSRSKWNSLAGEKSRNARSLLPDWAVCTSNRSQES